MVEVLTTKIYNEINKSKQRYAKADIGAKC